MATAGKTCFARGSYRFLPGDRDGAPAIAADHSVFELDESDVWNPPSPRTGSPEFRCQVPTSRSARKTPSAARRCDAAAAVSIGGGGPSSLPVSIPDWSKILKDDRQSVGRGSWEEDVEVEYEEDEYGDGGRWIPPHEFLARQLMRTRIASFSVHEGIGRTLKGRDLRRVRNAIWEKTGFQD